MCVCVLLLQIYLYENNILFVYVCCSWMFLVTRTVYFLCMCAVPKFFLITRKTHFLYVCVMMNLFYYKKNLSLCLFLLYMLVLFLWYSLLQKQHMLFLFVNVLILSLQCPCCKNSTMFCMYVVLAIFLLQNSTYFFYMCMMVCTFFSVARKLHLSHPLCVDNARLFLCYKKNTFFLLHVYVDVGVCGGGCVIMCMCMYVGRIFFSYDLFLFWFKEAAKLLLKVVLM